MGHETNENFLDSIAFIEQWIQWSVELRWSALLFTSTSLWGLVCSGRTVQHVDRAMNCEGRLIHPRNTGESIISSIRNAVHWCSHCSAVSQSVNQSERLQVQCVLLHFPWTDF